MSPVGSAIKVICYAMLVVIFVRVAFSWIGPNPRNALFRLCYDLSEPILRPIRNLLPTSMGIDFSPMIVGFALLLVVRLANEL